jgi:hypothetical protein
MRKVLPFITAVMMMGIAPAFAADDVSLPKISVVISLSAKATAKLTKSGETVHLSGLYYGMAKPGVEGDEAGQVPLGNEERELPGAGTVILGKIKFKAEDVAKIADGKANLNINVFTSRKKFADNLLDCGFFEDAVDVAARQPIKIACKLIAE